MSTSVKVRIAKYSFSGYPVSFQDKTFDCSGTGTKIDPAILELISDPKMNIEILESDRYIIIKDCVLCFLNLFYCKNISIMNCNLRTLDLRTCSNIRVEGTKCSWLKMLNCDGCNLIDSVSGESATIYKCYDNYFKNWKFWNFLFNPGGLSHNNILENCEVFDPEDEGIKLLQEITSERAQTYHIDIFTNSKGYISWEVDYIGTGTIDDPIIVNSLNSVPYKIKWMDLFHIREYLVLRNIKIKSIKLYDVKNLRIDDSDFTSTLLLKFCSEISINSTSAKKLRLGASNKIRIVNSTFNKIETIKGLTSEVSLKNVAYKKIDRSFL